MSNPVMSSAAAGHGELITLLMMQSQERMVVMQAEAKERKEVREELKVTVAQAVEALAGLFQMLRSDKKKSQKRDRKEREEREKKEDEREEARLAAKNNQGALSEQLEKIIGLESRIRGYEADIAGMMASRAVIPVESKDAEEQAARAAARYRVKNGVGQRRVVRPYGSAAAAVVPAEKDENYW